MNLNLLEKRQMVYWETRGEGNLVIKEKKWGRCDWQRIKQQEIWRWSRGGPFGYHPWQRGMVERRGSGMMGRLWAVGYREWWKKAERGNGDTYADWWSENLSFPVLTIYSYFNMVGRPTGYGWRFHFQLYQTYPPLTLPRVTLTLQFLWEFLFLYFSISHSLWSLLTIIYYISLKTFIR